MRTTRTDVSEGPVLNTYTLPSGGRWQAIVPGANGPPKPTFATEAEAMAYCQDYRDGHDIGHEIGHDAGYEAATLNAHHATRRHEQQRKQGRR